MKTRIDRTIGCCLMLMCLASLLFTCGGSSHGSARAEEQKPGEVYVVNTDTLNIRSGPGLNYPIVTRIKRGVEVSFKKSEGKWWQVDCSKGSGYVASEYLRKNAGEGHPEIPMDTKILYCSMRNLHVREIPSLNGKILGTLKEGTQLTLLSREGEWSEINYNGKKAWVAALYLEKVE